MSKVWGPWIEHDGKGFPESLVGQFIQVIGEKPKSRATIDESAVVTADIYRPSWDWSKFGKIDFKRNFLIARVLRYRIRKPRGLTILEGVLRETELEDA